MKKDEYSIGVKVAGAIFELCGGIALEKYVKNEFEFCHKLVDYGGIPTKLGELVIRAGAFSIGNRIATQVYKEVINFSNAVKDLSVEITDKVKTTVKNAESKEEDEVETVDEDKVEEE